MMLSFFLISTPVFADVVVVEKQNGVEQKILISGDKVQIRKRMDSEMVNTGMGSRMEMAKQMFGSKGMFDAAKSLAAGRKGMTVEQAEQKDKADWDSYYKTELRTIETTRSSNGKLSPENQARYDALMQEKKDRETMTPEGETVYQKKQREKGQSTMADLESKKGDLASEAVDKSLKLETYRFDQGRYYVVTPSKGSYTESSIEDERDKRNKGGNKSSSSANASSELKATGETEVVNGTKCLVYQGTLTMSGRPMANDRLCIAKTSPETAREYWAAQNRLLLEVGPSNPNPVESFFLAMQRSYFDELAKLPGIPLKRSMSMGRAGMGGSEVETTIVSTDKIDPAQFELPSGLKKK